MKKILKNVLILTAISIIFVACDDFIEKNIEDDYITLIAPANNLTTIQLTHTFWWDWLDGAEYYNMQIVEGSFSGVTNFVLDTIISDNKFVYTLYPGSFQWRVRGENNGGVTNFTTFNLTIDSSLNISTQQIILASPADNYITNNDLITITWNFLLNADDYQIEVHQTTWAGSLVLGPKVVTALTDTFTLLEGTFVWGVQGRNSITGTSTAFSQRTITIDTTAPNMVTLNLPVDNDTLSNGYNTFTWTQGTNTGTALTDDISFYSNAAATTLIKSVQAVGTSYQDSLGLGIFYWRVQSTDAAGNIGTASSIRKIVIQ